MWVKAGLLPRLAAVVLAILLWQVGAMALDSQLLLATPWQVLLRLLELLREPAFYGAVGFSLLRILLGFLLGLLLGTLLAVLAARWPLAETLLWPYITVIKTTPVASFIILCLIWLDSSNLPVFISLLMVLPVVYSNMLSGIRQTDRKLLEMARVFGVGPLRRLRYLYLPQLQPYLTSACSVALGLSWKAGIAAEVIGIPNGSIGEMLYEAKIYLSAPDLFAWTAVIITVSVAFERLFLFLLRRAYRLLGSRREEEVQA